MLQLVSLGWTLEVQTLSEENYFEQQALGIHINRRLLTQDISNTFVIDHPILKCASLKCTEYKLIQCR